MSADDARAYLMAPITTLMQARTFATENWHVDAEVDMNANFDGSGLAGGFGLADMLDTLTGPASDVANMLIDYGYTPADGPPHPWLEALIIETCNDERCHILAGTGPLYFEWPDGPCIGGKGENSC